MKFTSFSPVHTAIAYRFINRGSTYYIDEYIPFREREIGPFTKKHCTIIVELTLDVIHPLVHHNSLTHRRAVRTPQKIT